MEEDGRADYKTYQLAGLVLGPACFALMMVSPPPAGLSAAGWTTAALAVWMSVWWATEAIPLFATALLPLALLPALGVSKLQASATPYANPVVFLLFGGFLIALAVERWDLHRRIAFHIILRIGNRPLNLVGGVMLATAALSMWISNTATTVMMLPIAVSLVAVVLPHTPRSREEVNFSAVMLLGVAYAASIGGMSTLVGSPPNALAASYLNQTFGIEVSFALWMAIATPIAAVLLAAAFVILTRIALPFSGGLTAAETNLVAEMLRDMGRMTAPEKRVACLFVIVAASWILHPFIGAPVSDRITDTGIAIAGAIALFAIPADWRSRSFLLDWSTARKARFDILILFGGGLSLAHGIESSGLAVWIGNGLSFLHGTHLILLVAGTALLVVFLTELMSNTATAAAFLPVAGSLAIGADVAPLLVAVPVGLAASAAFMLPVATLPIALVYGTGRIQLPQMLRAGVLLSLAAAAVIAAGIALAASYV